MKGACPECMNVMKKACPECTNVMKGACSKCTNIINDCFNGSLVDLDDGRASFNSQLEIKDFQLFGSDYSGAHCIEFQEVRCQKKMEEKYGCKRNAS